MNLSMLSSSVDGRQVWDDVPKSDVDVSLLQGAPASPEPTDRCTIRINVELLLNRTATHRFG